MYCRWNNILILFRRIATEQEYRQEAFNNTSRAYMYVHLSIDARAKLYPG